MKRRDDDYVGRKVLEVQLSVNIIRKRGRPKIRYLDVLKEDIQEKGVREDEVFDRSVWRIHCGDPDGKAERRRRNNKFIWFIMMSIIMCEGSSNAKT